MSLVAVCDDRGRLTLGKEVIREFGKRFRVVVAPREIVLIPVPKDPVRDLEEMGKKAGVGKLTLKQLRAMAEEEAEHEVLKAHAGRKR